MAQQVDAQRAMSSYKSGTRAGRAVNDVPAHNSAKSTHNVFPMSYNFATTARYGEIAPFFTFNAVARDVVPLKSSFELRSLALKSPMMSSLYMKRAYFEVKHNAILPRTFEYIFKNPVQGDDVPVDAYCNINVHPIHGDTFTHLLWEHSYNILDSLAIGDEEDSLGYISVIRSLLLLESVYSNGSLLSSLGCPLSGYVRVDGDHDFVFDVTIAKILTALVSKVSTDTFDAVPVFTFPDLIHHKNADESSAFYATYDVGSSNVNVVSVNRMLELLRSYTPSHVTFTNLDSDESAFFHEVLPFSDAYILAESLYGKISFSLPPQGLDLSRLAAYQLICAEWYTNDKVDYIYNADLWRKAQDFFVRQVIGQVHFFDYNNIGVMYDALSARNWYDMQESIDPFNFDSYSYYLDFLSNLFFFNRSLKFEDYFSGSRTRPLAVGDNRISDAEDPIEIVRGIQLTRFLNAVNRAGMDEDYLAEIYGTLPAPDDTRPKWIATYDDHIESFEVNNTAQDQGKMTTALRSYSSENHDYTAVQVEGYPSIILGLYSFEMPRMYVQAIDRDFFVNDRFDMFNPYFQYDGDQKIFRSELFPITGDADDASFAYTGRGNHRKMRFGRACGGFVRNLPSWSFLVDDAQSGVPFSNLNPEFILSSSSEFDRFFGGFAGVSLDSYFHFIVSFVNTCNAVRPMEFAPAILNG